MPRVPARSGFAALLTVSAVVGAVALLPAMLPSASAHPRPGSAAARPRVTPPAIRPGADFNGDGRTDLAVWRPSTGTWYVRGAASVQYGTAGDVPVAGDYSGDGRTDIAVWRPSTGTWYVRGAASVQYGTAGDVPVAGDFNGDGRTDIAVWRPSTGTWYVRGATAVQYGARGDVPLVADFNGDGRTDIAVWRPSTGFWYVRGVGATQWGRSGDVPQPGHFAGHPTPDLTVWRPTNGGWLIRRGHSVRWGIAGDTPVAADYNGDGRTDIAVWRPSNGTWYAQGLFATAWGVKGDVPIRAIPTRAIASAVVQKALVIVEENHSEADALATMPFLAGQARTYGYATNYYALSHPSLPNYLGIAGGSTFGVTDDNPPPAHPLTGPSVFGQLLTAGRTAKTYAESMPAPCTLVNSGTYAVRHNPWTYFADAGERSGCQRYDVPAGSTTAGALRDDIATGALPTFGMLIPNICNDGHSCSLVTADSWLRTWLPVIESGPDFRAGRLAVIVTFDEDDHSAGNHVLTAVLQPALHGVEAGNALNHYSLTKLAAQLSGTSPLRNGAGAADLLGAFGL